MLMLKTVGVETILAFDPDEPAAPFAQLYAQAGMERLYCDPMAVLAYTGAYKRIIVPDGAAAIKLEAVGVPKAMVELGMDAALAGLITEPREEARSTKFVSGVTKETC